MPTDFWGAAFAALTPTVVIGLIFWFVMRSIIRADRTERAAYAKIEAEERARLGLDDVVPTGTSVAAGTSAAAGTSGTDA